MDIIKAAYARAKSLQAVRYRGLLLRRGIGDHDEEERERNRREHRNLRQN